MPKFSQTRDGLSPKQAKFVEEFLIDLNATEAARRAGYTSPNQNGPRTRHLPRVDAAIEAVFAARRKAKAVTAERVIAELGAVAFVEIDPNKSSALAAKVSALAHLGKHFGLFVDRTEISGPNGGPVEIDKQTAATKIAALMELARRRKGGDEG